MKEWKIEDIYNEKERKKIEREIEKEMKERVSFEERWKGKIEEEEEKKNGGNIEEEIREFEEIRELMGRIG